MNPSRRDERGDSVIAAVGRIAPVADIPDADLAIFLDGDITNFDDDNVLDFNYFCAVFTYRSFIDDFIETDRLRASNAALERELQQAKRSMAQQAAWIARLQELIRAAQSGRGPSGERKTLELFRNQNKMP